MSFYTDKIITEGISYNEIVLAPAYSKIPPEQTNLSTRFSRSIPLNIPLVSAGLPFVTESDMAIAMAHQGGLGIIHDHCSIQYQTEQVRLVKEYHNGLNQNPACINKNRKIADVLPFMQRKRLKEIPVVDNLRKLIGIVSREELKTISDKNTKLCDILHDDECVYTTSPVDYKQASDLLGKYKHKHLPVVNNNQELIAVYGEPFGDFPLTLFDHQGRLIVGAMVSVHSDCELRIEKLIESGADVIVLNTFHAHSRPILELLRRTKSKFGKIDFVVGNVVTPEAATDLALAGADGITVDLNKELRQEFFHETGVGYSVLPALFEVAKALTESGIPVIANDPQKSPGNIVKSLAAGAEAICLDQCIWGTDKAPGKTIWVNGNQFKYNPNLKTELQNSTEIRTNEFEKRAYQGSTEKVIQKISSSIRTGMSLCGAENLENLRQTKFIRLSQQELQDDSRNTDLEKK